MIREKFLASLMVPLVLTALVTGCGSSTATNSGSGNKVTLTYWTQFTADLPESQWINAAVKHFEDLHPNVTVNVVHETQDSSYFAQFQATSLAKTGPDIVDLWTGLYALRYKQFLAPLNSILTPDQEQKLVGLKYTSDGFSTSNNIYGIPSETQFYMGFYNKKLFQKAGITSPPSTYSEWLNDCEKLKAAGILPIADGGFNGSAYMPFQGFSYFLMNTLTADDLNKLRTGQLSWTSSKVLVPLQKWAQLYKDGYVNSDAMTTVNANTLFMQGKAAMVFNDGSWDIPQFQKALGTSDVGAFFPPLYNQNSPSAGYTVAYPGVMTAVTNYSKHEQLALEFIKDALDPSVMGAMAKAGLVPAMNGLSTSLMSNPLQKSLYNKMQDGKNWPMFDNLIQSEVANDMVKEFQLVALQKQTPEQALSALQQTWNSLPQSSKQ